MSSQPSWRYHTSLSQKVVSSKYSICWSFVRLVFWFWLSSFSLVLEIYQCFLHIAQNGDGVVLHFWRSFAPYAILIFHAALKTTYFMKLNKCTLKNIIKMFKLFELQLEEDMVRREDWSFNQHFIFLKKDQKFSISRPNN